MNEGAFIRFDVSSASPEGGERSNLSLGSDATPSALEDSRKGVEAQHEREKRVCQSKNWERSVATDLRRVVRPERLRDDLREYGCCIS